MLKLDRCVAGTIQPSCLLDRLVVTELGRDRALALFLQTVLSRGLATVVDEISFKDLGCQKLLPWSNSVTGGCAVSADTAGCLVMLC